MARHLSYDWLLPTPLSLGMFSCTTDKAETSNDCCSKAVTLLIRTFNRYRYLGFHNRSSIPPRYAVYTMKRLVHWNDLQSHILDNTAERKRSANHNAVVERERRDNAQRQQTAQMLDLLTSSGEVDFLRRRLGDQPTSFVNIGLNGDIVYFYMKEEKVCEFDYDGNPAVTLVPNIPFVERLSRAIQDLNVRGTNLLPPSHVEHQQAEDVKYTYNPEPIPDQGDGEVNSLMLVSSFSRSSLHYTETIPAPSLGVTPTRKREDFGLPADSHIRPLSTVDRITQSGIQPTSSIARETWMHPVSSNDLYRAETLPLDSRSSLLESLPLARPTLSEPVRLARSMPFLAASAWVRSTVLEFLLAFAQNTMSVPDVSTDLLNTLPVSPEQVREFQHMQEQIALSQSNSDEHQLQDQQRVVFLNPFRYHDFRLEDSPGGGYKTHVAALMIVSALEWLRHPRLLYVLLPSGSKVSLLQRLIETHGPHNWLISLVGDVKRRKPSVEKIPAPLCVVRIMSTLRDVTARGKQSIFSAR
jgi:hypothetical protein